MKPNSANRELGNLRKLYRDYWTYEGQENRENPFRNLRFANEDVEATPAFSDEWVRERILKPGVFDGLNREAQLIVYALIETGCQPSEIANLAPEDIRLDAEVPHILICPKQKRELKTKTLDEISLSSAYHWRPCSKLMDSPIWSGHVLRCVLHESHPERTRRLFGGPRGGL